MWQEFRFEILNGPTPLLAAAWEMTLSPVLSDVVDRLPDHTARLLSWYLASLEEEEPDEAIRPDLLRGAVLNAAKQIASQPRS